MLRRKIRDVRRNSIITSVGALIGGTVVGQAVTVLILPVLTRLYTPEDFSLLAVYVAITTLTTVVACLRLEIAIPIPKNDVEAANVLALGLLLATVISGAIYAGITVIGSTAFESIGRPEITIYGWLIPLATWMAGSYAALQYWATRKKRFTTIARTRIAQSTSGAAVQLGLGWIGAGPIGLLLGHAFMVGAGLLGLGRQAYRSDLSILKGVSISGIKQALITYRRFPQYSVAEAVANNAAIQLPVLIIAAKAIGPEAGYVILATKALGTPVNLLGKTIGQVYLSRAAEKMREGQLAAFTLDVVGGLARYGVPLLVFIAVVAPVLFSLVFGAEWYRAGELVAWMTPWFMFKLLSSPVSMVMNVKMQQHAMLLLMASGFILRVGMTMAAYIYSPLIIAEGYAVSGLVFYFTALMTYLKYAGAGVVEVVGIVRRALPSVITAAMLGYFVVWLASK